MNVSRFIAARYLFKGTRSGWSAVNVITLISGIGVMLTTAALFIVLSAFSGLKTFNLQLIDKTDPDLRIFPAMGKRIYVSSEKLNKIHEIQGVKLIAPVIEEKVFVRYGDKQAIVLLRGVDDHYKQIMPPDSVLISGEWFDLSLHEVVIGNYLANKLSVVPGDLNTPFILIVPRVSGRKWTTGNFRSMNTVVSGIYFTTSDFEKKYIFSSRALVSKLLGIKGTEYSFIDVLLEHHANEKQVRSAIKKIFPEVMIKDKKELNKALFKMLNTENIATYFVGTLILIISVFNIIGAIVILILRKEKDRFVLSGMGMETNKIRKIFFEYGMGLILLSGMIGLILGILIVFIQKKFGLLVVPGTQLVYPVEITIKNLLAVIFTLIFLATLSSYLASRVAKKK